MSGILYIHLCLLNYDVIIYFKTPILKIPNQVWLFAKDVQDDMMEFPGSATDLILYDI